MFDWLKRKAEPARVPPPLPPQAIPPIIGVRSAATPPPIPTAPRRHHHHFTHEFIPCAFNNSEQRGRFIAGLCSKNLGEGMRKAWAMLGAEFGQQAISGEGLEVTTFRHESCVCAFWQFPPAALPGEALCGLVVAGPSATWTPEEFGKVPVRYYVLERTTGAATAIHQWTPDGFVPFAGGPPPERPEVDFTDIVFERLFGKKRPDAQAAVRRLLVLKHLVIYSEASVLGKQLHQCPDLPPAAKGDMHSIMGGLFSQTLRQQDLWDHVSALEKQFFDSPVAGLTAQQVINASWRTEAAGTLMWALGIVPQLPPYDSRFAQQVTAQVPGENAAVFIQSARLRDENEINHARELAELWHWRSRTRQLIETNHPFQPNESFKAAGLNSFEDVIRTSARMAAERGDLPACMAEDFPAKGKAYRELTADEWAEVRSITMERHFTLNWLCGYAPGNDWDRTPTDT